MKTSDPLPSPASSAGTAPAEEVQALLADWVFLAEAAITALETDELEAVTASLDQRALLMPRIAEAIGAIRARPRAEMSPAAGPGRSQAQLPLDQIISDLQAADERLQRELRLHRARIRQELDQVEHGGTAASAYRQFEGRDLTALNLQG